MTERPFVLWKCAASLDGQIAAADGSSRWITSAEGAGRWPPACGAVMVGSGTQQADDPQLAVRDAEVTRQPLRIVVDSNIKDMLDRCDPVDFSGLSASSKDTVRHFYGDLVSDPAPRRPGDLIPKNQNESAVPAIVSIPEFAGKERSFPFAVDVDDPHRKTISGLDFLKGSAGLSSDDEIRDFVATQRPEIIRDLPGTEKVRLVKELFAGWVADDDIDAIEVIYRSSSDADKQQIRSAIDVGDLSSVGQRTRMRILFGP